VTSRERVLTAFDHREPDRVPLWCGSSPEFWAKAKRELGISDDEALRVVFGDDFRRVTAPDCGPTVALSPGAESCTVFGVERHGFGYGQPMSHPLMNATCARIEAYRWPDPNDVDVSHVRTDAESFGGEYAILGGNWSPFWHDVIDLLGMEYLYWQMFDAPELVDCVFRRTVDYYYEVSRRIFEAAAGAIDIFFIGNDFGGQTGPLIGERHFRRFISPHLKRLVDLGHEYGARVMLHCCGGFRQLLPAMVEIGLDAVHAVQPSCVGMDLAELKAAFGDKLVLNGAIDSHHVLIKGTPDLVREKTREVLDIMMPGGGFIAGASHDYILEDTPVGNVVAMFDTVREYGVYPR
jgi:uroporphyrinogen decarboxylase